ncbi:hypothetical protein QBC46DRAFT_408948 [Diplogelasinospora grovesii]|uniref:Uncharacterized protein n=1 Tax=Diplogelasinospora grovesii TaxID=303347 RepID=A0AAN6S4K3_9PEZI|nr:hypothetical protein QBC46DRAFT_408948 [Diplogelasinospora grovesii]
MRVKRNKLPVLDPPVWEEVDQDFDWQWAIVYEFVQGTKQDMKVAQTHLDFFYATGFAMEAFKQDNWHGGRLIDMNDVCSPFAKGWYPTGIRPRVAETWFWTLEFVGAPVIRRRIVRRPDNPPPDRGTQRMGKHGGIVEQSAGVWKAGRTLCVLGSSLSLALQSFSMGRGGCGTLAIHLTGGCAILSTGRPRDRTSQVVEQTLSLSALRHYGPRKKEAGT